MADLPSLHNPNATVSPDTSPQTLALNDDSSSTGEQKSAEQSPKGLVQSVVEKTVDKLGRSISGKAFLKSASQTNAGQRRFFSLSRKTRAKRTSVEVADGKSTSIYQWNLSHLFARPSRYWFRVTDSHTNTTEVAFVTNRVSK